MIALAVGAALALIAGAAWWRRPPSPLGQANLACKRVRARRRPQSVTLARLHAAEWLVLVLALGWYVVELMR